MRIERIEDWYFTDHPNQMCIPKSASNLCNDRINGHTGMSSAGITSIDLDRNIVITQNQHYELGKPAEKYVKYIEQVYRDYMVFSLVLRKWGERVEEENEFMENLKVV